MITIKKRKKRVFQKPLRINHLIRVPKVRVVEPDGTASVMDTSAAVEKAREYGLDLIEVSPNTKPPVCKIFDVGKYKYELEKKNKESRKHQANMVVKEMRLRPKIQDHDYQTKMSHVKKFLEHKNKVKIGVFFRGREITHKDLGMNLMNKIIEDLKDIAQPQNEPKMVGRSIVVMFEPASSK